MDNRAYYRPDQDRSEQCGWKKYCDEHVPTEAEQDFWAVITVVATLILGLSALMAGT